MAALVKISFDLLVLLPAARFLTAQELFRIPSNTGTRWSIFENALILKMEDQKKLRDRKYFAAETKVLL